tara:strand:+ start:27 stop:362 length:336 start_codon:yes stop_codon:yes gene_type:complete
MMTDDLIDKNYFSHKLALLTIGVISYIIAINFKFVIDIWYIFGSIAASSLLIPFLFSIFNPNKTIKYPILTLLLPILISLIWIYLKYPFNIDLMYPGILVSAILTKVNYEK